MKCIGAVALAFLSLGCIDLDLDDWPEVRATIRSRFPEVEQLSTAELQLWLTKTDTLQPLLLDVREIDEFAVSHLQGARRAVKLKEALAILAAAPLDTPVVVYCSIGYRSSELAQQLGEHGYTHVANLEGSIFAWANENRPLVDVRNQATQSVHPYGKPWSGLLHADHRQANQHQTP